MNINYLPQGERLLSGSLSLLLTDVATTATVSTPPSASKLPCYFEFEPDSTANRELTRVIGVSGSVVTIERGLNNGGVGIAHQANSAYKQKITSLQLNKFADAIQNGYLLEDPIRALIRVGDTQLTITGYGASDDLSAYYTAGRYVRVNSSDSNIFRITSSSYSAGTNKTTVNISGTLPGTLTTIELSLAGRGIPDIVVDRGLVLLSDIPTLLNPCKYDIKFSAKTVSTAADRYIILSPNKMLVYFNSNQYYLDSQVTLDLSVQATWDTISGTDYRTASNRIGKNFYIYACAPVSGNIPVLLVSSNATNPSGYTTTTSKKISGFHCLGIAVGEIGGHTLTGYVAGDILPQSVWDLNFKPQSAPEGMVYDSGTGKWVDIYLVSVSSGELASIYGATIADGTSSPVFHWYKYAQWFSRLKKKLPDQHEFMSLSLGANQGTNITGSADPGTTGGHTDTAGRRMISNIGCEDTCGVLWQWGRDRGGGQSAASFANAYDANDTGVGGQHYLAPNCAFFGGHWTDGVGCGSRGSSWNNGPLSLVGYIGARGVSEPVVI